MTKLVGFLLLVYLAETGLPPVALMTHLPIKSNHLPISTCNSCSTLMTWELCRNYMLKADKRKVHLVEVKYC